MLLLIANWFPLNLMFVGSVFDITFPTYVGFIKAAVEKTLMETALLLQVESIWIKYWIEFKWKSVRPIDDSFVVTCLVIVNIFIGFSSATITLTLAGGDIPLTYGIVSPFDRFMNMNNNTKYRYENLN